MKCTIVLSIVFLLTNFCLLPAVIEKEFPRVIQQFIGYESATPEGVTDRLIFRSCCEEVASRELTNDEVSRGCRRFTYEEYLALIKVFIEGGDPNWTILQLAGGECAMLSNSKTLLMLAIETKREELVRRLREKGARLDAPIHQPLTLCLRVAVPHYLPRNKKEFVPIMKNAFLRWVDNRIPRGGWNLVHYAVASSNWVAITLLANEAVDLNECCKKGMSPLCLAVVFEEEDLVRQLLGLRVDVEQQVSSGMYGSCTALGIACKSGFSTIARILLEYGALKNTSGSMGETPLHHAAYNGSEHCTHLLCNSSDDVRVTNRYGMTPLHCAAMNGHIEIVRFFVEEFNGEVEAQAMSGWTPLHEAVLNGRSSVVHYLLEWIFGDESRRRSWLAQKFIEKRDSCLRGWDDTLLPYRCELDAEGVADYCNNFLCLGVVGGDIKVVDALFEYDLCGRRTPSSLSLDRLKEIRGAGWYSLVDSYLRVREIEVDDGEFECSSSLACALLQVDLPVTLFLLDRVENVLGEIVIDLCQKSEIDLLQCIVELVQDSGVAFLDFLSHRSTMLAPGKRMYDIACEDDDMEMMKFLDGLRR